MMTSDAMSFIQNVQGTALDFDPDALAPSRGDIETMLDAAMQAPSALNDQAYWVTAVTDYDQQLAMSFDGFGNCRPQKSTVLLVWSRPEEGEHDRVDIGLSMAYAGLMAKAQGLGCHIYASTAGKLAETDDYHKYGIPEGYIPVEYMLVGPVAEPGLDGVSHATSRPRQKHYNIK